MKFASLLRATFLSLSLAALAPAAVAQTPAVEGKAAAPIRDVLVANVVKRVAVRLQSGEDIDGTVAAVGSTTVHLSKLTGKDFFDAVISIDKISAVIFKAR